MFDNEGRGGFILSCKLHVLNLVTMSYMFHYFSVKQQESALNHQYGVRISAFDQQHGVRISDDVHATKCIQMRSDMECMIQCSSSFKCCSVTVTVSQTGIITCCHYDVRLVDLQSHLVENPATSLLTLAFY